MYVLNDPIMLVLIKCFGILVACALLLGIVFHRIVFVTVFRKDLNTKMTSSIATKGQSTHATTVSSVSHADMVQMGTLSFKLNVCKDGFIQKWFHCNVTIVRDMNVMLAQSLTNRDVKEVLFADVLTASEIIYDGPDIANFDQFSEFQSAGAESLECRIKTSTGQKYIVQATSLDILFHFCRSIIITSSEISGQMKNTISKRASTTRTSAVI